MADASLFVHNLPRITFDENTQSMLSHINVGTGTDVTITELAETIKEVVGFTGNFVFDRTKPDGTPRKLLDTALLKRLGFSNTISLKMGLEITYENFICLNGERWSNRSDI
jgi:nucleoside-diphosphate-sugar epimerase